MGLLDTLVGSSTGLTVGDKAPAFTLNDQNGNSVSLTDFAGRKNVVVYFYPKDDTPGCTKESCTFRDQYTAFTDIGAEVLGISSDSEQSHRAFAEKYRLPFPLLADVAGAVRAEFRVPKSLGLLNQHHGGVGQADTIRHAFNSMLERPGTSTKQFRF
jgi:peroxiredoxin Q/BCP